MKKLILSSLLLSLFAVNAHATMIVIPAEIDVKIEDKDAVALTEVLNIEPEEEISVSGELSSRSISKSDNINVISGHNIKINCLKELFIKKDGSELENDRCLIMVRASTYDLKRNYSTGGITLTDHLTGKPANKMFDLLKIEATTNTLGIKTRSFKASNNQLLIECSVTKKGDYSCNIQMQDEKAPFIHNLNL